MGPSKVAEVVVRQAFIREVPGSNLGWDRLPDCKPV